MKLNEIRTNIDLIDRKIIALLAKRMKLARSAKISKLANNLKIEDKIRESEVLDNVKTWAKENSISGNLAEKLFKEIIKESRGIQK